MEAMIQFHKNEINKIWQMVDNNEITMSEATARVEIIEKHIIKLRREQFNVKEGRK